MLALGCADQSYVIVVSWLYSQQYLGRGGGWGGGGIATISLMCHDCLNHLHEDLYVVCFRPASCF